MKKTIDLLNEVIELGFDREKALEDIDACLDEIIGVDEETCSRPQPLADEEIEDELYDDILYGFKEELEVLEMERDNWNEKEKLYLSNSEVIE